VNIDRKSQQELIQETNALAAQAKGNHRLGESYIIESNAKLIESNARVEGEIGNLINKLQGFNKDSSAQTKELINLTQSIKSLNTEDSVQTAKLITLTRVIVILTVVLVIGLIIQICLRS
jgi:hypothetical protein